MNTEFNKNYINRDFLFNKINKLKQWLYRKEGLGLMHIIDELFEPYKTNLDQTEINNFFDGLKYLKLTNYPQSSISFQIKNKLINGDIKQHKILKDKNGKWDILNKFNTSTSCLSELLIYIIIMMKIDQNSSIKNLGDEIYNKIIKNDVKNALLLLKTKPGEKDGERLKNIIKYYTFDNGRDLDFFKKFTKRMILNSAKGDNSEKMTRYFLELNGFNIKYTGGNGCFIDMLFGCDIIAFREDYGYVTIQVKSFVPEWSDIEYYKINWLSIAKNNFITLIDAKTKQQVKL